MRTSHKIILGVAAIVFIMFAMLNMNTRITKSRLINLGK